ncbi:hypothetical protein D3227_04755 [Mesorhizobium waimense]|uniref:Uncharacterized protein n=1 Tax=Mesorhizobium waimense TaxID=1300307 RepID=A0A3A5LCB6_9HYPH|nr:hypothetical protein [Mesorhizobium waimense]RJT41992.1 hypothetical protein D3227_04755 [Mesorhizobium waimense]
MNHIKVDIRSSAPIFIEANADTFGRIFAAMNSEDQVSVLSAIEEHLRPHPAQWDYISFELEKPEHARVRDKLKAMLLPVGLAIQEEATAFADENRTSQLERAEKAEAELSRAMSLLERHRALAPKVITALMNRNGRDDLLIFGINRDDDASRAFLQEQKRTK